MHMYTAKALFSFLASFEFLHTFFAVQIKLVVYIVSVLFLLQVESHLISGATRECQTLINLFLFLDHTFKMN